MFTMNNLGSIKIFLDGPNIDLIKDNINFIDGYTFNPTLFRKLGVINYLDFCNEIIKIEKNRHLSFEVLSDDEKTMIDEAISLSELSNNVWVKIPITFTNGESTINVLKAIKGKVKLNITAIFTLNQIEYIIDDLVDSSSIFSIFAGRIYDIGLDAFDITNNISKYVHNKSNCKILWASPRMSYDVISAIKSKCDIITMSHDLVKKIKLIGTSPDNYSLQTVKMFYEDALTAEYKI